MQQITGLDFKIKQMAKRIKELREITDAAIVSFEYAIQGNAFKNPEIAKKMQLMLDHMEDNDDVQQVFHNWENQDEFDF